MNRVTITALAALMLGGASVAWAAGADKSSGASTTSDPARSESSSGSGTSSGMSAGGSSTSGSAGMKSGTTSGTTSGASSGATAGSTSQMTEAEVKDKLQKQGYTQISGITKSGDKFEAKAMKNGKSVEVEIDPATGMVKEKS